MNDDVLLFDSGRYRIYKNKNELKLFYRSRDALNNVYFVQFYADKALDLLKDLLSALKEK